MISSGILPRDTSTIAYLILSFSTSIPIICHAFVKPTGFRPKLTVCSSHDQASSTWHKLLSKVVWQGYSIYTSELRHLPRPPSPPFVPWNWAVSFSPGQPKTRAIAGPTGSWVANEMNDLKHCLLWESLTTKDDSNEALLRFTWNYWPLPKGHVRFYILCPVMTKMRRDQWDKDANKMEPEGDLNDILEKFVNQETP